MKNKSFFRVTALLLIWAIAGLSLTSCMTNRHTVGNGVQTGVVQKTRQWYAFWGLVSLGDKDTRTMAGNSTDYQIETYYNVADWFINLFLGAFTIQSRTIKVTK